MQVYRITLHKWSHKLHASGYPGRWNSKGVFVIYSSHSRALASLENLAHRSGEGLNNLFSVMVIEIPDKVKVKTLKLSSLPRNWFRYDHYTDCQSIGDRWIDEGRHGVMRVPSAMVPMEYNYLLNPNHPDFSQIQLIRTEKFSFDPRLK